jgi:AcrR family transcriptional regulator
VTTAPTGDRTRRRLRAAAAAEVARHGPAGASLTGIAAAAGLRTGSVYFHFASKDVLVATMLEEGLRESQRLLDEALDGVADAQDARGRLRAAVHAHLTALDELRDYATVVLATTTVAGPDAAEFARLRRLYLRRWTGLVREAQDAGALAAGPDPRVVRDLVIGALNGMPRRPGWVAVAASAIAARLGLDGPP